jgi:hypothetical protein
MYVVMQAHWLPAAVTLPVMLAAVQGMQVEFKYAELSIGHKQASF